MHVALPVFEFSQEHEAETQSQDGDTSVEMVTTPTGTTIFKRSSVVPDTLIASGVPPSTAGSSIGESYDEDSDFELDDMDAGIGSVEAAAGDVSSLPHRGMGPFADGNPLSSHSTHKESRRHRSQPPARRRSGAFLRSLPPLQTTNLNFAAYRRSPSAPQPTPPTAPSSSTFTPSMQLRLSYLRASC